MAFPWSRSDAVAEALPRDSRRPSRGRRARQEEARRESSKASRERQHQRLAFAIGGALILVVVAVLAFGVYQEYYKPPRVWAGSVRNVEFTMGELVKRIRVQQGLTGQVNLSTAPLDYLRSLLDAEILRQASPGLGITLTDEDIDEALKAQFYPEVEPGKEGDPGQLDREFAETYQIFLNRTRLSDDEYRIIVEEQLALTWLRILLSQSIDDPQEQVEVAWIRLERESGITITAEEVMDRLELLEFTTVANDVGIPLGYADANGYVGWVPRQAFPNLDHLLYGDEEKGREPLFVGEISNPEFTLDGTYIVKLLSGPEEHEISESMGTKLTAELLLDWQRQQQIQGAEAGWLKMNFNSKWYDWVADQVQNTAPNLPQGQGGR